MPDETILEYATFTQIVDELTKRYKSGVVIISKAGGMESGDWGDDQDKLGLMQIATDIIICRTRAKYYQGTNEDV